MTQIPHRAGHSQFRILISAGALLLLPLAAMPAHAGSILNDYSPNGILFTLGSISSFEGAGPTFVSDSSPPATDSNSAAWGGQDPAGHYVASATSTLLPSNPSPGKDIATGTAAIDFYFGETVDPFDSLWLDMDTTTSAVSAQNSVGEDANAVVRQLLTISFAFDSGFGGVAPHDYLGTYHLGGLRAVNSGESYSLKIKEFDGFTTTTTTVGPGGGTAPINLYADHGYELIVNYEVVTPFGVDPTYSLHIGGDITPFSTIPEPSTALLLALGLAVVARTSKSPSPRS